VLNGYLDDINLYLDVVIFRLDTLKCYLDVLNEELNTLKGMYVVTKV
jgi:hypothetical protein